MRGIYVRLDENYIEALVDQAREERRHPSDQAALLIIEALRNRARRSPERTDHRREQATRQGCRGRSNT